ncbi:MAG TPA: cytochrome b N-terminal domain-containing protein [Gemmatimonadaceae bacterium]|nr:cytochrome b N-terminal domain-containing protein [Gemmatimonadaceae bacterium]
MTIPRWVRATYEWLDFRLKVGRDIQDVMAHPVPSETASWWYVFGSATAVLMTLQFATGILLALVYVPSAAEAWQSLHTLNYQIAFGWYVRAVHGWGSNFMVAVLLVHMIQVFLFGAFKYPRELTWTFGVLLLLLTLAMAFTGQIMRFDGDAYWGLGIGAAMAARVPFIGAWLVGLLIGGPIIAGQTLSRFFTFHVFVLPALLIFCVGLHVLLVLKVGISEWPMPGRLVRRKTYIAQYEKLVHDDGVPFVPNAFSRDLVFDALVIAAVLACAAFFGPFGPAGRPDPTLIDTAPKPDLFFLWLYAALALLPAQLETPTILIAPVVALVVLFALPFVSGEGERSWKVRPMAVLIVVVLAAGFLALTWLGIGKPWSPVMSAWSGAPIPPQYIAGRTPLEVQGALVFQNKQCRNCHLLGGQGGEKGPPLDAVAVQLTKDQLIRQVLQGSGEMPAYGHQLSPAQVEALVAFLRTLHPPGEASARVAATAPPP